MLVVNALERNNFGNSYLIPSKGSFLCLIKKGFLFAFLLSKKKRLASFGTS